MPSLSWKEDVLFDIIPKRFLECVGDIGSVIKAESPAEIRKAFGDLIKELLAPLRLS